MGLTLNEVISIIREKTGLSEEDIKEKISKKWHKSRGYLSEEGAAHVVASNLNVDLMEDLSRNNYNIDKFRFERMSKEEKEEYELNKEVEKIKLRDHKIKGRSREKNIWRDKNKKGTYISR